MLRRRLTYHRITELGLHRNVDPPLGYDVAIGGEIKRAEMPLSTETRAALTVAIFGVTRDRFRESRAYHVPQTD
jgi:hypothetical protein